jgi:hypothetical protein
MAGILNRVVAFVAKSVGTSSIAETEEDSRLNSFNFNLHARTAESPNLVVVQTTGNKKPALKTERAFI